MIWRILLLLLACVAILSTAIGVYVLLGDAGSTLRQVGASWDRPAGTDPTPRVFEVREGQSAAEIGSQLEQQGLIRSALLFRVAVQTRGVESRIGHGVYLLRPSMTTSEVVDTLVAGAMARGRRFTIPEGWRAAQVARLLERLGYVGGADFLAVVATPSRIAPYHFLVDGATSLEGYLFPETYEIESGATAEAIAQRMVRQFDKQLSADLRREAQEHGLSLHQAVTLASIVEREAAMPDERRLISGVFHNRLKAGMPLQADPTVQFAVANQDLQSSSAFDFWKRDLTTTDLALASPYNTYLVTGLPPGPICNPGLASLTAAIDPQASDFYYFLARGDGSHVFARTLEEHLANLRRLGRDQRQGAG